MAAERDCRGKKSECNQRSGGTNPKERRKEEGAGGEEEVQRWLGKGQV